MKMHALEHSYRSGLVFETATIIVFGLIHLRLPYMVGFVAKYSTA